MNWNSRKKKLIYMFFILIILRQKRLIILISSFKMLFQKSWKRSWNVFRIWVRNSLSIRNWLIKKLLWYLLMDVCWRLVFLKRNFRGKMEFFLIKNWKYMFVLEIKCVVFLRDWKECLKLLFGVARRMIILKKLLILFKKILDFNLIMCFL